MERIKFFAKDWKLFSVLTTKKINKNEHEITGYSEKTLNKDDEYFDATNSILYTVIEEKERRDAKGKWNNGEEKNRWFRAVVRLEIGK